MDRRHRGCRALQWGLALVALCAGCRSPYYSDQGAMFGGLTGAGVGAIVGNQLGSTLGGAAIGAGVGALTGAAVGNGLDEVEARNRAMIAQTLGRPVAQGAATTADVIAMSQARVSDDLIVNHIRANGVAAPLRAADVIYLQQQGVSSAVIQAMQNTPVGGPAPVMVGQVPPPPVVYENYYAPPPPPGWWGPPYHCYHPHFGPRVGWGVSISSDRF
ncbi:MAG: hypothetical protein K1X74_20265 [Pirellulales bacterium]|nr:hypothetical protein [Pirellulales bacterium]